MKSTRTTAAQTQENADDVLTDTEFLEQTAVTDNRVEQAMLRLGYVSLGGGSFIRRPAFEN